MFFEPSNKNEMNCERFLDCSWFQEKPKDMDFSSRPSPVESSLPDFEKDFDDFEMQFADINNPPWGGEHLGIFDDDDDVKKLNDKIEEEKVYINNNPSNNDIYLSYNNYKAGNSVNETYNVNYLLKKTESFDSMKNIPTTNPAEVVPISFREKIINSQYGLQYGIVDEVIKSEVKEEEAELYSPVSNTYMVDSDDSDLLIGREEVIEVDDRNEYMEDISKKLPSNSWPEENENIEPIKIERSTPMPVLQDVSPKPNVSMSIASNENLISTGSSLDVVKPGLSLDLAKAAAFEPTDTLNTPDLDFMDLVNYITSVSVEKNFGHFTFCF